MSAGSTAASAPHSSRTGASALAHRFTTDPKAAAGEPPEVEHVSEEARRIPDPDRAMVLGCAIDRVDMDEAVRRCDEFIRGGGFCQHMAVNAAKLVSMRGDHALREITDGCALVTADGQAVVWAARLLGDPLPGRVAGIDLMDELFALGEKSGYSAYILGARPEVLEQGVAAIRARHPRLRIAGYRDGYYADSDAEAVAAEIRAASPDMLFVAMSSPRKEYFLGEHGAGLGVPFVMGVGGAIDVLAGVTRRAPGWMQKAGLEWLYRLMQEPHRLLRRYAVTNALFVSLVLREAARRRLGGRVRPRPAV
jgi:N-acetylglucosaminyldiphosphoundecaprenol N-acetyl-beta-D-mannosaminyltransferase